MNFMVKDQNAIQISLCDRSTIYYATITTQCYMAGSYSTVCGQRISCVLSDTKIKTTKSTKGEETPLGSPMCVQLLSVAKVIV